jgi:hypothetical protein
MKKHSRLWVLAVLVLWCAVLLCGPRPPAANAQEKTVEWVETGRFGSDEGEERPLAAEEKTARPHKWLYVGVRLGPSLRIYTPSGDTMYTGGDTRSFSLDAAVQANLRLLPFLSLQGEMIFTWDNASYWNYTRIAGVTDRYTRDYTSFSLQFPLLVRLDLYPGKFRVSPFLGLYVLAPLGRLKTSNSLDNNRQSLAYRVSPPVGLSGGLNAGREVGPGNIFIDLRYAVDLGEPRIQNENIETYQRSMVSLSVGYEWGFITKRENTP